MACNCGQLTPTTPTAPSPKDCLCVEDFYIPCSEGVNPCGGVLTIDLKEYNDTTASTCDVVYTLTKFENTLESVTLTTDGILTITSKVESIGQVLAEIDYHVNSPCSLLSESATVSVCVKDLCRGIQCENVCDPCTALCVDFQPELDITDSSEDGYEINIY